MVTFDHFYMRADGSRVTGGEPIAGCKRKAAFMIESIMYFTMGFLLAAVSALVVVSLVHGRAVRRTARQLESATPLSTLENQAQKDLLRTDFARPTRELEIKLEQLQAENASQLAQLGEKCDAINRRLAATSVHRRGRACAQGGRHA
jgi:uncharacterized protein YlxW (UPF0749 family)